MFFFDVGNFKSLFIVFRFNEATARDWSIRCTQKDNAVGNSFELVPLNHGFNAT